MSKNKFATEILNKAVVAWPKMPGQTLARKLFRDHPLVWPTINAVRLGIQFRRGRAGKKHRRYGRPGLATPASKYSPNNPLGLPPSDEKPWIPFVMDGCARVLTISDLHLPYHNMPALTCALKDGLHHKVDGVLINGDLCDFHQLSRFVRDPSKRRFKAEREIAVAFLGRLRELFPRARIVFKAGNHDERLWTYLAERLTDLFDDDQVQEALSLPALLQLAKFDVEHVGEKREVMLGGLPVLHGHEFRAGFAPPVNPARGAYLKAKDCVMVSHHHKSSEHTETTLGRKIITTWSLGCLCELRPAYDPYNGWNHGHAIVEVTGDNFHVINKRQLGGKVL